MKDSYAILGIAVVAIAAVGGVAFSASSADSPEEITGVDSGEEAILSFATYDASQSSSTQVASTLYYWDQSSEDTVMLEEATSATERTEISALTGDDYQVAAFDSAYRYGEKVDGDVERKQVNKNLDVFEAVDPANLDFEVRDGNDEVTTMDLGAQEQKSLDEVYVRVADAEVGYNANLVLVEGDANFDVTMPNEQEVDVPEAVSGQYDKAYEVWGASGTGEPNVMAWEEATSSFLNIEAGETAPSDEELNVAVVDKAAFINDANELEEGVEDNSENIIGDLVEVAITVNPA